ncbi:hypothetical protein [Verminephrobacter eiseniae]|uniref:hypothetical protein n=1 Tax=Verminephrobacter eiseniae TaxID=364317 RepID=UPI0022445ADE|nr:hypothetical protein [Verminephrobacter eiseniae]
MAPLTQGAVERIQKMGACLLQAHPTGRIARPVLDEPIGQTSKRRQDGRGGEKPGRPRQSPGTGLVSRHRSSVGLRWPSKRIAALHRLPIQLGMGCAMRLALRSDGCAQPTTSDR